MYPPSFYIKVARPPSFCNPRSVFAFRGFIKSSTCEASLDRASNTGQHDHCECRPAKHLAPTVNARFWAHISTMVVGTNGTTVSHNTHHIAIASGRGNLESPGKRADHRPSELRFTGRAAYPKS